MSNDDVMILARKHCGSSPMLSSARVCLNDAVDLTNEGDYTAARKRAVDSLKHSIGVFHIDYRRASAQ